MSGFSGGQAPFPAVKRVVLDGETATIYDTESLIVSGYFEVQGATGTLEIQGDGVLEIL